jgi:TPR repeat protein
MWRRAVIGLVVLWMTTASSCQTSYNSSGGSGSASGAAAGIGVAAGVLIAGIYCIGHSEECFPDEEAIRARAAVRAEADAAFTAGLRDYRRGDPEGLRLICLAAQQGQPGAQYFYGVHLATETPRREAQARLWLHRAARQGHRAADLLLRSRFGETGLMDAPPEDPDTGISPPAIAACNRAAVEETKLSRQVS